MMLLAILMVTLVTAFSPLALRGLGVRAVGDRLVRPLTLLAAALFFFAFWLPDVGLFAETQTFQQHFVGGGLYAATMYAYLRTVWRTRLPWYFELTLLFAFVSTLGVATELAEFAATRIGALRIDTDDTAWDLVANTSGALLGFAIDRLRWFVRGHDKV